VIIDFQVQDVSRLTNVAGPFDLVLDIGCLHSLPLQKKSAYLDQLAHLLAIGGSYLLYTFLNEDENSNSTGNPGLTTADLQALASQLDLIEKVDGLERNTRPSAWLTFQSLSTREHQSTTNDIAIQR
jgi:cyclopropane fatty-acyl-phospholipid synthase-like methyltransferase